MAKRKKQKKTNKQKIVVKVESEPKEVVAVTLKAAKETKKKEAHFSVVVNYRKNKSAYYKETLFAKRTDAVKEVKTQLESLIELNEL